MGYRTDSFSCQLLQKARYVGSRRALGQMKQCQRPEYNSHRLNSSAQQFVKGMAVFT
jgi:hypothetical protein